MGVRVWCVKEKRHLQNELSSLRGGRVPPRTQRPSQTDRTFDKLLDTQPQQPSNSPLEPSTRTCAEDASRASFSKGGSAGSAKAGELTKAVHERVSRGNSANGSASGERNSSTSETMESSAPPPVAPPNASSFHAAFHAASQEPASPPGPDEGRGAAYGGGAAGGGRRRRVAQGNPDQPLGRFRGAAANGGPMNPINGSSPMAPEDPAAALVGSGRRDTRQDQPRANRDAARPPQRAIF